jgi:hypothetical protein
LKAVREVDSLPTHFRQLVNDGPNVISRQWVDSFRPTVQKRMKSRVSSGYVLQLMTCMLDGGQMLLAGWCGASARGLAYLSGVLLDRENFFLGSACGCTLGRGSIDDEDSSDDGGRRHEEEKNGCSHIGSVFEIWTQYLEDQESFCVVARKSKTVKLDDQLRHLPLGHALQQLEVARKRLYLQSVPLNQPSPVPICVCRRPEGVLANAVVVECSICEERYHHKCILLSRKAATEIDENWGCGFCLEAEDDVAAGNSSSGEGRGT